MLYDFIRNIQTKEIIYIYSLKKKKEWRVTASVYGITLWNNDKNILGLDIGNGCTTL